MGLGAPNGKEALQQALDIGHILRNIQIMKLNIAFAAVTAGSLLLLSACSKDAASEGDDTVIQEITAGETIIEVARGDETLSTFASALAGSDFAEKLAGDGPFTLLAPTDEAFARSDAGGEAVLAHHIIEGAVDAASLIEQIEAAGEQGFTITTLSGSQLTANRVDGAIVLSDDKGANATVTAVDVEASNGLVHIVDAVLQP